MKFKSDSVSSYFEIGIKFSNDADINKKIYIYLIFYSLYNLFKIDKRGK